MSSCIASPHLQWTPRGPSLACSSPIQCFVDLGATTLYVHSLVSCLPTPGLHTSSDGIGTIDLFETWCWVYKGKEFIVKIVHEPCWRQSFRRALRECWTSDSGNCLGDSSCWYSTGTCGGGQASPNRSFPSIYDARRDIDVGL